MSTESEQEDESTFETIEVQIVEVSSEPIELYKVLKIANMVSGGGEAKVVISEGYVYLNNELEYQKRKKVYHEDYVAFNGEVYQVHVVEGLTAEPSVFTQTALEATQGQPNNKKSSNQNSSHKKSNKLNKKQKSANEKQESAKIESGKRRPISF